MTTEPLPNPGSPEAREAGCCCAVLDNGHGRGRGDGQWWVSEECPLHGTPEAAGAARTGGGRVSMTPAWPVGVSGDPVRSERA